MQIKVRCVLLSVIVGCCGSPVGAATGDDPYAAARRELVEAIREHVRETSQYLGRDALNPKVLQVLGTIPRQEFVPAAYRAEAYDDRPLPIGYGQTISQPSIVAIMTDLLDLEPDQRVLEIGTGSGYQAAVLSRLVDQVYSIEIIEPLGKSAAELFARFGYDNIRTHTGDGYYGWEAAAPFDAIVVTAAASHIPPPLLKQLKPGGRMVIPVGTHFLTQQLLLVIKDEDGGIHSRQLLPVAFVPLRGGH